MFKRYSAPPNIMLDIYRYSMFFSVYFIFLYLNDVIDINMLIIIFMMNNCIEFILIKSVKIEILPMNAPRSSLYISVFLFSINETDNNNKKSNPKFNSSIRSI